MQGAVTGRLVNFLRKIYNIWIGFRTLNNCLSSFCLVHYSIFLNLDKHWTCFLLKSNDCNLCKYELIFGQVKHSCSHCCWLFNNWMRVVWISLHSFTALYDNKTQYLLTLVHYAALKLHNYLNWDTAKFLMRQEKIQIFIIVSFYVT